MKSNVVLWTTLLGVVLISSGGHAQVPDNTLQFQPINAQPQQPQQQFGQQDQPQQSGQQSQWQQFGQQQSQPQQPVTSTSTQNFSPSVKVPNEHNPTHFPGSSSFQAAASPVVAQNSQFDGRLQQIIAGSERFALDLFSRTVDALDQVKHNFIISPFSVWSLLVLTAEGARGNTFDELQRVLGLSDDFTYTREVYRQFSSALSLNTSSVELTTSQSLFSDKNRPIDPEYERTIESFYNTDQVSVDFTNVRASLNLINEHVRQATRGRIDNVISVQDLKDATLLLMSTIFFKGMWRLPFNRSYTHDAPFYDENGLELGHVNMMFNRGPFPYTAIADLNSHILELPYGRDDRLSMIILLPRKNVTLQSVIRSMATIRLQRIYDELNKSIQEFEDDEVEVFLPRFTIQADFLLNGVIEAMGILDVFDPRNADLTKITAAPIFLSRLIHKAKIEVNEEGSVASAVTAGTFANKATPPRFVANRPFAYMIVDKISKLLLFCGQAENPKKFG